MKRWTWWTRHCPQVNELIALLQRKLRWPIISNHDEWGYRRKNNDCVLMQVIQLTVAVEWSSVSGWCKDTLEDIQFTNNPDCLWIGYLPKCPCINQRHCFTQLQLSVGSLASKHNRCSFAGNLIHHGLKWLVISVYAAARQSTHLPADSVLSTKSNASSIALQNQSISDSVTIMIVTESEMDWFCKAIDEALDLVDKTLSAGKWVDCLAAA